MNWKIIKSDKEFNQAWSDFKYELDNEDHVQYNLPQSFPVLLMWTYCIIFNKKNYYPVFVTVDDAEKLLNCSNDLKIRS